MQIKRVRRERGKREREGQVFVLMLERHSGKCENGDGGRKRERGGERERTSKRRECMH